MEENKQCNIHNFGFSKWLLQISDFGNAKRYIYIESKDDFIDDDGNRYTWEDLYKIYQKN